MTEKQIAYMARLAFAKSAEGQAQEAARVAELAAKRAEELEATREWGLRRMERKEVAAVKASVAVAAPRPAAVRAQPGGAYSDCLMTDDEENGRPFGYSAARHY